MIYIFDLDGTLADIEHRLPLIRDYVERDYEKFYDLVHADTPILPTIYVLDSLWHGGHKIWIWTGRSEQAHGKTVTWLKKHGIPHDLLKMRPMGDHRPDHVLKEEWILSLGQDDLKQVAGVFEDRNNVVKMWRARGLQCYHVAHGDF